MFFFVEKMTPRQKTFLAFLIDAIFTTIAYPSSYLLRYGRDFFQVLDSHHVLIQVALIISFHLLCFNFSGMYRGVWRYSSVPDLLRVLRGVTTAVALSYVIIYFYNGLATTPRSILVIDWLLLVVSLGGWRLIYRILRDRSILAQLDESAENAIIVGAGAGGDQLIREIRKSPGLDLKIAAFVDDDPGKRNKLLHGIPVMGKVSELSKIVRKVNAKKILIAIPSATGEQIADIVDACSGSGLEFKTLPHIKDIFNRPIEFSQLKSIEAEDLLGRKPISIDNPLIEKNIADSIILVTGAGGSIGSEICRQICKFRPKKVILFDSTELFLYEAEQALSKQFPDIKLEFLLGDIRNLKSVESVFLVHRPSVVFHAAAYKHVPLMEKNPKAAIQTNVFGTKILAEAAVKYDVERFVMVSSDKAVNPTNVMGASKRIAEMVCQDVQKKSKTTKFITVRFGNVLGSSGSVIPLFKKQIQNGGPITITHPEMRRFFMSISEAAQLVLQAGVIGNGAEIFVLDMGKEVKITDLATRMISLAGLQLNKDIEIEYTGIRPGEKLYEELLFDDEKTLPTTHPQVRIASARQNTSMFNQQLIQLEEVIERENNDLILKYLTLIAPEYIASSLNQSKVLQKEVSV